MATDTARIQLELASGKNEPTAPFHQTAQRRRKQHELDAASVDAPAALPPISAARPPWIAFAAALVAVAVAVWWVMAQRLPEIDVNEVIARNLDAGHAAMAEGRYTDPPERSALHYYSTVLALDTDNADAIAGIDAIADRHLTDARVLLAEQKIAEASVALEQVRRLRPDHNGLAALDAQWRAELRRLLAASSAVAKNVAEPAVTPQVAKQPDVVSRPAVAKRAEQTFATAPKVEAARSSPTGSVRDVMNERAAQARVANVNAAAAALAANSPSTQLDAIALPIAESDAPNTGVNIAPENAAIAETAPSAARSIEPKLVKLIEPKYPEEALMRGLEGWVELSLQVSPAGDVIEPRIENSSRGRMFNRAALSAVQQWKYEPRSDGSTSERVRVRVQFRQSD